MIYLYSDVITAAGGIETYLHALSTKLHEEGRSFRVAVSEQEPCALLDDLEERGVDVYRQPLVPGDRWHVRKRLLMLWLWWHLEPGDWVFCVRQPIPAIYHSLVRLVHSKDAKIAASWMFAPEFIDPEPPHAESFRQAVDETDVVISVSECTRQQFSSMYDYDGEVEVVRYHNLPLFDAPVSLPDSPPWRVGYMGRINIEQKNLDQLIRAIAHLRDRGVDVVLNLYGSGQDVDRLMEMRDEMNLSDVVTFHGRYDHRTDLHDIMAENHVFTYTSNYEGGPCFTLLELLQAGRYVVAAPVGGIPDLYDGHPEAGLLVNPDEYTEIADGLFTAFQRLKEGTVDPRAVRARYFDAFDMDAAHLDWVQALNLEHASAASSTRAFATSS